MVDELIEKQRFDVDGHIYRSYDWDSSDGWENNLAQKLTPIIRQLYVDCDALKRSLEEIGLDDQRIKEFIDKALKANIPNGESGNPVESFRVNRADFAEVLALICLEGLHGTCIPAKNIFYRELTHASGRGVDILGYEKGDDDIALIICEVKGSQEGSSPPRVVESGNESMKEQLYSYISNKQKTLNRILNVYKKSPAEHKVILSKIALWWSKDNVSPLRVVVCPFLVRKSDCYKETDFGSFKNNPIHFSPAKVRFLIVCLNEDLNKLSQLVYSKARGE